MKADFVDDGQLDQSLHRRGGRLVGAEAELQLTSDGSASAGGPTWQPGRRKRFKGMRKRGISECVKGVKVSTVFPISKSVPTLVVLGVVLFCGHQREFRTVKWRSRKKRTTVLSASPNSDLAQLTNVSKVTDRLKTVWARAALRCRFPPESVQKEEIRGNI